MSPRHLYAGDGDEKPRRLDLLVQAEVGPARWLAANGSLGAVYLPGTRQSWNAHVRGSGGFGIDESRVGVALAVVFGGLDRVKWLGHALVVLQPLFLVSS